MWYLFVFVVGLVTGGLAVVAILDGRRRRLVERTRELDVKSERLREGIPALNKKERELAQRAEGLKKAQAEFDSRAVSFKELQDENAILKHDLRNIDVSLRKLRLDGTLQLQAQEAQDKKVGELGSRYMRDNVKWIGSSLTANNYANCKKRLLRVLDECRGIGFEVSSQEEESILADLKQEFEKAVRIALEREEQARIKAQIREEQALQREIDRELERLDRERKAIQAALEKALAEAKDEHSAEVDSLRSRLAEAEANSERAKSRAQLTKCGHVYVISNLGSFGEGVYKIGMTRRLEPLDRVKELGDASVPFPFDVHMMISSDDAPALEGALHRSLHNRRMNKVNPRKEFFRTDFEAIRGIVDDCHGKVDYVADAEALEFRESLAMSEEDSEFIESVYERADEGRESVAGED